MELFRALSNDERGFGLAESTVATFVAVMLFLAFGMSFSAAFKGSAENRAAQAATAVAVQHLEIARSLTWAQLGMSSVDAAAPLIDPTTNVLLASKAGITSDEALVQSAGALLTPKVGVKVDSTDFTVWRYVSATSGGLRRVVIVVEWKAGAPAHRYQTSMLISQAATR